METPSIVDIALKADRLITDSRLQDFSFLLQTSPVDRVKAIASVINTLPPGGYLIGCGPYCCGIYPLSVDEIVLGRPITPLEKLPDAVADYTLNDAVWMLPREVSRIHASILREQSQNGCEYFVRDENSQNGTYLNSRRISVDEEGNPDKRPAPLASGDTISLGPSRVNTYVFVQITEV